MSEPPNHPSRSHPVGWWVKLGAVTAFIAALTAFVGEATGAWEAFFGRSSTSAAPSMAGTEDASTSTQRPPGESPSQPDDEGSSVPEATNPAGCTVTVENPFATIHEDPEPFAQEIRRVPEGTYAVVDRTVVSFGGRDARWLYIRVEGDEGWIEDSTMFIAARSSDCDF